MDKRYLTVVISFALALATAFVTVAAIGNPDTAVDRSKAVSTDVSSVESTAASDEIDARVTEVVKTEQVKPSYDEEAVKNIVSLNRVFGDCIYYDEAILEAAEISLLDKAEDIDGFTYLKKAEVNDFIYSLYGRRIDESVAFIEGVPEVEGYYPVLPIGYDFITHEIELINVMADGRLEVISEVTTEYFDRIEVHTVRTVLSATQSDNGYVIISADIAE